VPLLIGSGSALAQTLRTLYNLGAEQGDGTFPWGIKFDHDGKLIGCASLDGYNRNENGAIFQLTPPPEPGGAWMHTVLYRFRGAPDGDTPECVPTIAPNGSIYGTTYLGGANSLGTVFVVKPPAVPGDPWIERPIYSFGAFAGDGINPNAGVSLRQGRLFGVTSGGGATGEGTIYVLDPPAAPGAGWTETILHSFGAGDDAAFPLGELAIDAAGNIYGNSILGGTHNVGAVYRVSPPMQPGGAWTGTVLHSFEGSDGSSPEGPLLIAADGSLYGGTGGGGPNEGGTIFKLTPPTGDGPWTHEVVFAFTGGRDGGSPAGGVRMDAQGRLWGTTQNGGSGLPNFGGVLFVLHPPVVPGDPWTETVLNSFGGPDGFRPMAPLQFRDGAVYGATTQGGDFGTGTVFEFSF
jgi:uncharacterized repeat protein (TIGR03803 family)